MDDFQSFAPEAGSGFIDRIQVTIPAAAVFGPHRRCWTSRSALGRWPSRLAATAAENLLSIKRNLYKSFSAASDCRTIVIYGYTPF
jgi:hypothetical protein